MPRLRVERFDLIRYGWVLAVIVVFGVVYGSSCQRIPVLQLAGAQVTESAWRLRSEPTAQAQAAALLAAGEGAAAVRAGVETVEVRLSITLVNPSGTLAASVRELAPFAVVDGVQVDGAAFAPYLGATLETGEQRVFGFVLRLPVAGLEDAALAALAGGGTVALALELDAGVAVSSLVDQQQLPAPPLTVGPLPSLAQALAPGAG